MKYSSGFFLHFSKFFRRKPVEPARSHKQLFLSDYVKKARKKDKKSTEAKLTFDGKEIWRVTEKKDKKKWLKMLEPQRQRYCHRDELILGLLLPLGLLGERERQ